MRIRTVKIARRLISTFLAAVMCFSLALPALAAETAATVRLGKAEGTVNISNASGRKLTVREKMSLFSGYSVATEEKSYAWFVLDDSKLSKLDALSGVELRKSGKKLELLLTAGNIYFNVSEPLKSDESMNIRTSTMVMGIRGTSGWVTIVDRYITRVHLLTGKVQCAVKDPVTGQSKTTTLNAGDTADFVVYRPGESIERCGIIIERFAREDIPGFVLTELLGNEGLCEEIYGETGIDLRGLTADEATELLAQDQEAIEHILEQLNADAAEQAAVVSRDLLWKHENSGTAEAPDAIPVPASNPKENVDVSNGPAAVEALLDAGSDVAVGNDGTSNIYLIDSDLTVPKGTTLTIADDLTTVVAPGKTVNIYGTLNVGGDAENNGTINVYSSESAHFMRRVVNNGEINNLTYSSGGGAVEAIMGIDNYGSILCEAGSTMFSSSPDGTVRMRGQAARLTVSGGNITNNSDGAALALEAAGQITNIVFTEETLLQSIAANVLTVGGKRLDVEKFTTDFNGTYYQFHIDTKTATFSYDRGHGAETEEIRVIVGYSIGSGLPEPVRAGHVLEGWITAGGERFTSETVVTEDMTVYAGWSENTAKHTVTFDANGGTLNGNSAVSVTVVHNGSAELPVPSAPDGYLFYGWFTERDSSGRMIEGGEPVTGDVTYYARWVLPGADSADSEASVVFDANGGTLAGGDRATVKAGGTVTLPTEPVRGNYSFKGWNTKPDGSGTAFDGATRP